MPLLSDLSDVALELRIGRFVVPLADLPTVKPERSSENGARGEAVQMPAIEAPDLAQSFRLLPMQKLALRQLIEQAGSARVRVVLPLPKEVIGGALLNVDLTGGHDAIVDLVITDEEVIRTQIKGTLDPPIDLPLGAAFNGLTVDEDGCLNAEIENFPDINLTRWLSAPRVPADLDELLALFFDRKPAPPNPDRPKLDLKALRVHAVDVRPRGDVPFDLGPIGQLVFHEDTCLDISYHAGNVKLAGKAVISQGHLEGAGFVLRDIGGACNVTAVIDGLGSAERHLDVSLQDLDLIVGSGLIATRNGSRVRLGRCVIDDGDISACIHPTDGFSLLAKLAHVSGDVEDGVVAVAVGGRRKEIELGSIGVDGSVVIDGKDIALDLAVDAPAIELDQAIVDLGPIDVSVQNAKGSVKGRIAGRIGERLGFNGSLDASASAVGTRFLVEGAAGALESGSTASVSVTTLVITSSGLESLVASGRVDVVVSDGRLPLGQTALDFSDGVRGAVELSSVVYDAAAAYPSVEGSVAFAAQTEPATLGTLASLPAAGGQVRGRFAMSVDGATEFTDLALAFVVADQATETH